MKILVVGSGGREHALAWSFARCDHEVMAAPGNPGTDEVGENIDVAVSEHDAIVRAALEDEGYEFEEADSVASGWNAVDAAPPALVVLDYEMPGGDGFELVRKIRADARFAKLPVVMLTGHGQVQRAMEGIKLGTSDYIVKPFDPEDLLERVRFQIARGGHAGGKVRFPGLDDG